MLSCLGGIIEELGSRSIVQMEQIAEVSGQVQESTGRKLVNIGSKPVK